MMTSATFVFGLIVCVLGFLLVWLVYYFWKAENRADPDYHASVKAVQNSGRKDRQHPRTDVSWPVSMETSEGTIKAEVKNISMGGAFICCEKPFPIGEMFDVTMVGPDKEPVIATAKVVWSNANVPDNKVINRGMGVRFIKMSDRHIQLVRQVCQEMG
jgi:uncharacterized protein (TIGR02266 family)